jgi:hypothetical protein
VVEAKAGAGDSIFGHFYEAHTHIHLKKEK